MKLKPSVLVALAVSLGVFLGCTPKASGNGAKDAAAATAVSSTTLPTKAEVSNPQPQSPMAEKLQALGLTVFPEPQALPDFTLPTPDGGKLTLSDMKGKVVFLNFWATWCPPCRAEMPSIEKLQKQMAGKDFSIFAVSVQEDPKTVKTFLDSTPYSFPIAMDSQGTVSSRFVGRGIPTTYLVDKQGRAIAGIIGSRQWDTAEVYEAFELLTSQ